MEKREGVCENSEKVVKNNQDGLQCDLCDQWFHCACEKVGAEHYRVLSREDSRAQWYCGVWSMQTPGQKHDR